jgi:hypothetical protein
MTTQARVDARIKIERDVVLHLIRTMEKHGWHAGKVWNGEEDVVCTTEEEVISAAFAVDECSIYFYNTKSMRAHSAFLVFGNDGWDVICDYSYSVDDRDNFKSIMENEVNPYCGAIADKLNP